MDEKQIYEVFLKYAKRSINIGCSNIPAMREIDFEKAILEMERDGKIVFTESTDKRSESKRPEKLCIDCYNSDVYKSHEPCSSCVKKNRFSAK